MINESVRGAPREKALINIPVRSGAGIFGNAKAYIVPMCPKKDNIHAF